MAYKKTLWKDRVVEKPNTYRSVENPDGTITLYPITGQVIEKGTPVSAANLNKIENGIVELNEQLEHSTQYLKSGSYTYTNFGKAFQGGSPHVSWAYSNVHFDKKINKVVCFYVEKPQHHVN